MAPLILSSHGDGLGQLGIANVAANVGWVFAATLFFFAPSVPLSLGLARNLHYLTRCDGKHLFGSVPVPKEGGAHSQEKPDFR